MREIKRTRVEIEERVIAYETTDLPYDIIGDLLLMQKEGYVVKSAVPKGSEGKIAIVTYEKSIVTEE